MTNSNKNTTTNPLILKDNPTTIKAFTGIPLLATIDYNGSLQCTNYFNDILEKTANWFNYRFIYKIR